MCYLKLPLLYSSGPLWHLCSTEPDHFTPFVLKRHVVSITVVYWAPRSLISILNSARCAPGVTFSGGSSGGAVSCRPAVTERGGAEAGSYEGVIALRRECY